MKKSSVGFFHERPAFWKAGAAGREMHIYAVFGCINMQFRLFGRGGRWTDADASGTAAAGVVQDKTQQVLTAVQVVQDKSQQRLTENASGAR